MVVPASFGEAELAVDPDGRYRLYLRGADGARLGGDVKGTVKVAAMNHPEVPLAAAGEHLEGRGPPGNAERPTAVVVLRRGDRTELLRFAAGAANHGHGGVIRAPPAPGLEDLVVRVTDSTCLLKGDPHDEGHRECAIRCIHGGAAIALVDKATNRIHVAVAAPGQSVKDLLLAHVGSEVVVRGARRDKGGSQFFEVHEVYPSHDHTALEGGAVGMAGDLHLEVLALQTGELRLYLSDAFRQPVPPAVPEARAEVRDGAGTLRPTALIPDAKNRFLTGGVGALGPAPVELTVFLKLGALAKKYAVPGDPSEPYFMTFVVDPLERVDAPRTRTPSAGPAPVGSGGDVEIIVQGGYAPAEIRLKRGVPARLKFVRKDASECSRELVIPALGVRKELAPLKETVVELTPDKAGPLEFTCGMNMLKGRIVVED